MSYRGNRQTDRQTNRQTDVVETIAYRNIFAVLKNEKWKIKDKK